MEKIRALVVDDEPLARERLINLLRNESDIEVVGECADGDQAMSAIGQLEPDLLFLDIELPNRNGLELTEAIGAGRIPMVIFVTAYEQYALRAFDVQALDYLLKPFDRERFQRALQRVRARIAQKSDGKLERMSELVSGLKSSRQQPERLIVKSGGRVLFIRTDEIDWIEAAGNYAQIHVGTDSHLLRETMTMLEQKLDSNRFFRIHRSRIVNMERIAEMRRSPHGEYLVILHNGTRLTLSRSHREKLETRLAHSL